MADNVVLGPVVSAGFILQAEKVVGGKEDAEFGGHRLCVGPKMMVYPIIEACFHNIVVVSWLLAQHSYSEAPNISKPISHAQVHLFTGQTQVSSHEHGSEPRPESRLVDYPITIKACGIYCPDTSFFSRL